jgi:hypothetical protein
MSLDLFAHVRRYKPFIIERILGTCRHLMPFLSYHVCSSGTDADRQTQQLYGPMPVRWKPFGSVLSIDASRFVVP